jgi:hypothetical protein
MFTLDEVRKVASRRSHLNNPLYGTLVCIHALNPTFIITVHCAMPLLLYHTPIWRFFYLQQTRIQMLDRPNCIAGYALSRVIHRIHSKFICYVNHNSQTEWLGMVSACVKVFWSFYIGSQLRIKHHLNSRHLASYLVYGTEGVVKVQYTIAGRNQSTHQRFVGETPITYRGENMAYLMDFSVKERRLIILWRISLTVVEIGEDLRCMET